MRVGVNTIASLVLVNTIIAMKLEPQKTRGVPKEVGSLKSIEITIDDVKILFNVFYVQENMPIEPIITVYQKTDL